MQDMQQLLDQISRTTPPKGSAKRKNYNARSSSSSGPKPSSLQDSYNQLQLSHYHQVRALCDMSMEQQVREYLNHCQVPLVPPSLVPPNLVPPLVPQVPATPPSPHLNIPTSQHSSNQQTPSTSQSDSSGGGGGGGGGSNGGGNNSTGVPSRQNTPPQNQSQAQQNNFNQQQLLHQSGQSQPPQSGTPSSQQGASISGINQGPSQSNRGLSRNANGTTLDQFACSLGGGLFSPSNVNPCPSPVELLLREQQQQFINAAFSQMNVPNNMPLTASPTQSSIHTPPSHFGGIDVPAQNQATQNRRKSANSDPKSHATSSTNNRGNRKSSNQIAMTSQPSNESELQLYRVLQRANLLAYFDTFICQGGDDVQQLCEAGEEEFLEIMALVGMASKPLHVRRLQKALQEWVNNPAMFQSPINPTGVSPSSGGVLGVISSSVVSSGLPASQSQNPLNCSGQQNESVRRGLQSVAASLRPSPPVSAVNSISGTSGSGTPGLLLPPAQQKLHQPFSNQNGGRQSPSSPSANAVLEDIHIARITEVAEHVVRSILPTLSPYDIKNMKKRISKDMEFILNMSEDDPRRLDEIRKYSAIYGRFDCKRKPEKGLTLHEVAINEASAQLCRHLPALLSRRDELFPLARQVIRDCGYQFAKTDECSSPSPAGQGSCQGTKRSRTSGSSSISSSSNELGFPAADKAQVEDERKKRQERLEAINEQLRSLGRQQEELKMRLSQVRDVAMAATIQQQLEQISAQQMQLLNDQNDVSKQLKRIEKFMNSPKFANIAAAAAAALAVSGSSIGNGQGERERLDGKTDTDDTDSQMSAHSYSNNSSPPSAPTNTDAGHLNNSESPSQEDASPLWKKQKTTHQITKQLVQETLMDEGLRVIRELANQIRGCSETSAVAAAAVAAAGITDSDMTASLLAQTGLSSSPSPIIPVPLSLTCNNSKDNNGSSSTNNGTTTRSRGRPPRLDRGDYVGTSRTISHTPPPPVSTPPTSSSTPPPSSTNINQPLNMSTSASPSASPVNNSESTANGHKSNGLSDDPNGENSLNALLALSQKGILKQEPASPQSAGSSIKI